MQLIVSGEFAGQPEKGFFKVVVRLGGDIVVLQVLLAVEGDLLGLDFTVLDFHLVSGEYNGNILANTGEITVPIGNVLVGHPRRNVEHDNRALPLDVVSVAESTEFFLPRRVPNVEFDGSTIGVE